MDKFQVTCNRVDGIENNRVMVIVFDRILYISVFVSLKLKIKPFNASITVHYLDFISWTITFYKHGLDDYDKNLVSLIAATNAQYT